MKRNGAMRALVVDDEVVSRSKLQKIMERFGHCDAADGGSAALEAFRSALEKKEPYDLVTLDVAMPEMDGTRVLNEMRKVEQDLRVDKSQRVKVVMVTAHADKDTVITCIQAGCDEYIKKPFDRETISQKLQHLGFSLPDATEDKKAPESIRDSVLRVIAKFKRGDIDLPVMPSIVQEIQEIMNRPGSTAEDLRRVVEKEVVISARLISLANSPMFRGRGKVQAVSKAISRLGFKETQSLILAIASKGLYESKSEHLRGLMEKLRLFSLACAHCAAAIAGKLGFMDAERYFFLGLIHDIGNVLLLRTLGDIVPPDASLDMENDILTNIQTVHASFGAALLQRWKLTDDCINVARLHEGPHFGPSTPKEVLVVNLANHLACHMGYCFFKEKEADLSELESTKMLGLSAETLQAIGEDVKKKMESGLES